MLESGDSCYATDDLPRDLSLDYNTACQLASLPLKNIFVVYPNCQEFPKECHPTFYGCYDWHSSVHSHWLLAKVGNLFRDSEICKQISDVFRNQFTKPKIQREIMYFECSNGLFERPYGWTWLLKLQSELQFSGIKEFRDFSVILRPLADKIVDLYISFLPRLVYPVRAGEHANTAFGLVFALEYARSDDNKLLEESLKLAATKFFLQDRRCALSLEPGQCDFLSPALQEAELMSRVIEDRVEYTTWLENFLPQIFHDDFKLETTEVVDPKNWRLVHLDGLNFSRAWNLYNISSKIKHKDNTAICARLVKSGDNHILQSIGNVVGSDYAGSHWLASFLLHALDARNQLKM